MGVGEGIENNVFIFGNNCCWILVVFGKFFCFSVWYILYIDELKIWLVIEIIFCLLSVLVVKVNLFFLVYIRKFFGVFLINLVIVFNFVYFLIVIIFFNCVKCKVVFIFRYVVVLLGILYKIIGSLFVFVMVLKCWYIFFWFGLL